MIINWKWYFFFLLDDQDIKINNYKARLRQLGDQVSDDDEEDIES